MIGKKVFVYYNLHKHVWSVKDVKTGRVIGYTNRITLKDVEYKVSEAGRNRVLREGRKNIHAGVKGIVVDVELTHDAGIGITYNPYKYASFVEKETEEPVFTDDLVLMEDRKVYAIR